MVQTQIFNRSALPVCHMALSQTRNLPSDRSCSYAKFSVSHSYYLHDKHVTETEVERGTNSPMFQARLNLEYLFEEKQIITAEIFQCEQEDRETTRGLESIDSSLNWIVFCTVRYEQKLSWWINHQVGAVDQKVCIREDPFSKENINIKIHGTNLDKKYLFGKSDPYVIIYRRNERGKLQKSYRTEVIKNTLSPDFRPILVCLSRLCGGNIDAELCFRCFDWDGALGESEDVDTELDDVIGEFYTNLEELLRNADSGLEFQLINNAKKKRKKLYQNSGLITVRLFTAPTRFTFLDYILGGTSINVVVGVDMSNHLPTDQLSANKQLSMAQSCNEFSVAIRAVMEILQEYDSDQLFPAFGFGSKVSAGGRICNTFPLNGDADNHFCKGMIGVLEAYERSFNDIHMPASICFGPLIRDLSETARQTTDATNYYVLLILTNGTVDDWVETKRAVIETSNLPISIIVIGIGSGKFAEMEILDQDFSLLKVGHERATRDNVQFVQMRRFLRMAADGSESLRWSKVALAKEVLAELPTQLMNHFERKRMAPCKDIPGQAKVLSDLVDPNWWHLFTKPIVVESQEDVEEANKDDDPKTSGSMTRTSRSSCDLLGLTYFQPDLFGSLEQDDTVDCQHSHHQQQQSAGNKHPNTLIRHTSDSRFAPDRHSSGEVDSQQPQRQSYQYQRPRMQMIPPSTSLGQQPRSPKHQVVVSHLTGGKEGSASINTSIKPTRSFAAASTTTNLLTVAGDQFGRQRTLMRRQLSFDPATINSSHFNTNSSDNDQFDRTVSAGSRSSPSSSSKFTLK